MVTATSVNALTLTAAATGFTIAGGTASKTLTLNANLTAATLADITAAEADQIEAIGATTISAAQWGYLGGMNQDVITTSTVQFAKLGLGTATIPHGGIGAAMLAMDGPNASVNGPHIQITTDADDYPLMQFFYYTHDNIWMVWDGYYDAGGDKSSDVGSNYRFIKAGDLFKIQYDSGNAQGAAITWNNGIVLDTSGQVTIANLAGTGNRAVYVDTNGKLYEGAGV